jgi:hypothetical protein
MKPVASLTLPLTLMSVDLSEMGHSSGGSGKSALGWFLIPSTEIISGLTPDR